MTLADTIQKPFMQSDWRALVEYLAYKAANPTTWREHYPPFFDNTPLWDSATKYIVGSEVLGVDYFKYVSKTGTVEDPNIGNNPVGDTINWEKGKKIQIGFTLSHTYFEDIRKVIFLLYQFWAGNVDETDSEYIFANGPEPEEGHEGDIYPEKGYAGDWIVVTNDPEFGYIFWKNSIDVTKIVAHTTAPPPAKIHPDELWEEGTYNTDDFVIFPNLDEGKLYRAKRTTQNPALAPPDSPDDWELQPTRWLTTFGIWQYVDSPNFYHHLDENSPAKMIFTEVGTMDEFNIFSRATALAYLWLPKQADPKEITPVVICNDTAPPFRYWQYNNSDNTSQKVKVKKQYISDCLGAIFDCWRYGYGGFDAETEKFSVLQKDAYGILFGYYNKTLTGNQYCNYGGFRYNCPIVADSEGMANWTANPKVLSGSYQAAIETLLSQNCFQKPATEQYKLNWILLNVVEWAAGTYSAFTQRRIGTIVYQAKVETSQEPPGSDWIGIEAENIEGFNAYPSVCDYAWGMCESGFELLKFLTGKYDYYFDMSYPYWPDAIVQKVTWLAINDLQTKEESFDYYALDLAGVFRTTWERSFARPGIFMRSKEMGAPSRDAWTGSVPGVDITDETWFSNRKTVFPALNEFDAKFAEIIQIEYPEWAQGRYPKNAIRVYNMLLYITKIPITAEHETETPVEYTDGWAEYLQTSFLVAGDLTLENKENWTPKTFVIDSVVIFERRIYKALGAITEGDKNTIPSNSSLWEVQPSLANGYMVHLCRASTQLVSGDGTITAAYVLSAIYDSVNEQTKVTLTEPIKVIGIELWDLDRDPPYSKDEKVIGSDGKLYNSLQDNNDGHNPITETDWWELYDFKYIGWNPEISDRHDPKSVYYDKNGTLILNYGVPSAEMILEMMEVLTPEMYRPAGLSTDTEVGRFIGWGDSDLDPPSGFNSINSYINSYYARALAFFVLMSNPDYVAPAWVEGTYNKGEVVTYSGKRMALRTTAEEPGTGNDWLSISEIGWNNGDLTDCTKGVINGTTHNEMSGGIGEEGTDTVGFYALAIKAEWPVALKTAPKKIKVLISYCDSVQIANSYLASAQKVGVMQNAVVSSAMEVKKYYNYLSLKTNGEWLILEPYIKKPPYQFAVSGSPPVQSAQFGGIANLNIQSVEFTEGVFVIEVDLIDVPQTVFDPRCIIGHIDWLESPGADTNPPFPVPVWLTYPYASFIIVKPYGEGRITNFTNWYSGLEALEDDYVVHNNNLYQATCDVVNVLVPPADNPLEYRWIPDIAELWIKAESCICEDLEGHIPVEYKMECEEDAELNRGYLSLRSMNVYVKDIELTPISLYGVSMTPNGYHTRIAVAGTGAVFWDMILFKQCGVLDGIWPVVAVDEGDQWLEIDTGTYVEVTFVENATMYNLTQDYTEEDWENEDVSGHHFKLKAKDSVGNETQFNNPKTPAAPIEWLPDLM